ncbi:IS5 family transposase, partial [Streptomyces sp. NPDC057540]|uniref:IS5 family transposase n=1 Tax=Streptomyces sp. NPDC057540 TaxID=3346160 RepID=UPI0036A81BA2
HHLFDHLDWGLESYRGRRPGASLRGHEDGNGDHDPGRTYPEGLAAEPDDHAIGRSRDGLTTKIHLAVDASFHVLATAVTAGQRGDAPLFTELMNRIRVPRPSGGRPRTRPAHVLADRAYSSREIRAYLRRRQIPHTIPEKRDQAGHRRRRGSTGGRPPGIDREKYKARHSVENRIALLKQARGVATRYDKLAVRYEATIQLTLIRQAL